MRQITHRTIRSLAFTLCATICLTITATAQNVIPAREGVSALLGDGYNAQEQIFTGADSCRPWPGLLR
jgi:hypothetical protein